MERDHIPHRQRNSLQANQMLRQSQHTYLHSVPPAIGGNGFQFPHHGISARSHNFHHMPNYHQRSVPYGPHYNSVQNNRPVPDVHLGGADTSNLYNCHLIPSSNSMSHYAPQSYGSSMAVHNRNHSVQESYTDLLFQPSTRYSVEQHTVISAGENNLTWKYTETSSFSHGNNVRGSSVEIRDMGRLQHPEFEIYGSLDSHVHPAYMNNYQLLPHQTLPPIPVMRGNNFNLQLQVPSSPYSHQMNNPQQHYTSHSSWDRIDDRNRNFRPSIPIDQMRNREDLPPEDSTLFRLEFQPIDDVMVLGGVENSDVSDTWLEYLDDLSYEELLDLEEQMGCIHTGLSEETILRHLQTRNYISSANQLNNEAPSSNQEPEICVICQVERQNHEKIGTLQCGHDYHADCIKRWLQVKNVCPVCKATALIM